MLIRNIQDEAISEIKVKGGKRPLHAVDHWYLSLRDKLLRTGLSCETMIKGAWSFSRIVGFPIYKLIIRADVKGQENIPPDPVILSPRHSSFWDIPISAMALAPMRPYFSRPFYYLAKRELFDIPIFRSAIWALGAFPVRRGENDTRALARAIEILNSGHTVMIFPEGTRKINRQKSELVIRGKTGAIRAAVAAKVPIVPVGMQITSSKNREISLKHNAKVRIGKPISYAKYYDQELDKALLRNLTDDLMERIRHLSFCCP